MICDRIFLGVCNINLKRRLLRTEDLPLAIRTVDCCRAAEVSKSQARDLRNEEDVFYETKIKPLGKICLAYKFKNVEEQVEFLIVDDNCVSILGLSTCIQFNLNQKVNSVNNFESKEDFIKNDREIFEGVR